MCRYHIKYVSQWRHRHPLKSQIGFHHFYFPFTILTFPTHSCGFGSCWFEFTICLSKFLQILFLCDIISHLSPLGDIFTIWHSHDAVSELEELFPWSGLVMKSATIFSVWQYSSPVSHFSIRSCIKSILSRCVLFGLNLTRAHSFQATLCSYCLDITLLCSLQIIGSKGRYLSITLVVTPRDPQLLLVF